VKRTLCTKKHHACCSDHYDPSVEAARSFFTSHDAHQVDKMLAQLSEDARLRYVPMGGQGEGRAREVGKIIWSGLIDAFPDLHVTVQSLFGDERHAAAEIVIGGTQRKISSGSAARASATSCRMRSFRR
jgi:hypothetical protein